MNLLNRIFCKVPHSEVSQYMVAELTDQSKSHPIAIFCIKKILKIFIYVKT